MRITELFSVQAIALDSTAGQHSSRPGRGD